MPCFTRMLDCYYSIFCCFSPFIRHGRNMSCVKRTYELNYSLFAISILTTSTSFSIPVTKVLRHF